jgi:hypothetical protein
MHRTGHRRVCSRADEELRDQFKLARWVHQPKARREVYFAWCARAASELRLLNSDVAPKEESLILMLIAALAEDESFAGYVRRRRGSFLTDDGNWDKLYRAGAATILEEYFDATESGCWP